MPLPTNNAVEVEEMEKTIPSTEHDVLSPRGEVTALQVLRQHVCAPQPPLPVTERIPPEIWALVFEHSLSEIYSVDCSDASQIVIFGLVCRCWRSITLSSPRLWRHLPRLRLDKYKTMLFQYKAHTRGFLERGGDTPISFYAEVFHVTAQPDIRAIEVHPVFMLLVSQCRRWKHIILKMSLTSMKDPFRISGKLPLLHTLELEFSTVGNYIT